MVHKGVVLTMPLLSLGSSRVRAVLLLRASSGLSPDGSDHETPSAGAPTLTLLPWHISNRNWSLDGSRCCPDPVFNAHFSGRGGRGGSIPAMLGSHSWAPTTSWPWLKRFLLSLMPRESLYQLCPCWLPLAGSFPLLPSPFPPPYPHLQTPLLPKYLSLP